MKAIIELVEIANPRKEHLRGKVLAFVGGIQEGKIQTKADAIQLLFKDNADAERSLYYLIERTKRILLVSTLTAIKSTSDHQRNYNKIHSGFASVMILMGAGKNTFVSEAKKILQLAIKYELVQIANALAVRLSKYYAEVEPNKTLHRKFLKEAEETAELVKNNTLANNRYSKAVIAINNRSSYTKGIVAYLQKASSELEGKKMTVEATTQHGIIQLILCFAQQDYSRAALLSNQKFKELEKKAAFQRGSKLLLLSFQSVAAIAGGQHEVAEEVLLKAISITNSMINWQVFTYYRAINAFHERKYFKAQHLRDEAARRQQPGFIKEYWAIISAYLYFFNGGDFRLGKFFNETIEASQDKAGLNVNIIIADLLISLTRNRDRFIHRIEAIRTYTYRHLKGKANERVRFFLDLLFQIPRNDFHRPRIERATSHIRLKLGRRSVYANHNLEIEIVPFEDLWEVVLERLGGEKKVGVLS